jgi:hypothetical protein
MALYIAIIKNNEQQKSDLSGIIVCFAYVLRRTKPLKDMISSNYFSVG